MCLDILDLKDYGPENCRRYRYVLVIIDNFSKYGWKVPLKIKKAQTKTYSSKIILKNSKRKPNLIETVRDKGFFNSMFQNFLVNNSFRHYSRNTYVGAVFAEKFNRTIRNLVKRPVFEKGNGKWIDVLQTITKQYINRIHSSTKLTPIQASLKKIEGFDYNNLLDEEK